MQLFSEEEIMSNFREEDLDLGNNQLLTKHYLFFFKDGPNYYYKEAPLQLIDFSDGKFNLKDEALNMIRSIEEELIVVSIVGKARTGKSFLMNLLLDQTGKGGVRRLIKIFLNI